MPRGRTLVARLLHFAARGGVRTLRMRVGAFDVVVDTGERFQAEMATRVYERDVPEIFARVLRPGDLYVDVGAHVGYLAAHAARSLGAAGRMVLFEPDPRALALLRSGLGAGTHGESARCEIHAEAVSDVAGTLPFVLHPCVGWGQIVTSDLAQRGTPNDDAQLCHVPAVRLDDALTLPPGVNVRLLKMDVEGHELQALEGASAWLRGGRVDVLLVEKNDPAMAQWGLTGHHLAALLLHYGYTIAHMRSEWLDLTNDGRMAAEPVENFLCARDAALLETILPHLRTQPRAEPIPAKLVAELVAEVHNSDHPNREAQRLVARARDGRSDAELDATIAAAQEFLARNPEQHTLRGHVAHWLMSRHRYDEAHAEYGRLLQVNPDDSGAREAMARCEDATRSA
jgi:FkbM family methyltransferase